LLFPTALSLNYICPNIFIGGVDWGGSSLQAVGSCRFLGLH
jgi:hypothetical protein